jgi:hypothetical protein
MDREYNNGEVIQGNGIIEIQMNPIGQAAAATVGPTPTPTPIPTPIPTPTPAPSTLPDGNVHNGAIVYYERPTPAPTVIPVGENSRYINSFNYFKCTGLNMDYDLEENVKLKAGSTYKFNIKLTNLRAPLQHTVGTITGTTLNEDFNLNIIVLPPTQIFDEKKTVGQYETLTISKDISVPAYKGHYKLYFVVTCDNGASAEIMQEITIV